MQDSLPCRKCSTVMRGITDYDVRTLCEDCGGNRTEYKYNNPLPDGMTDRARKEDPDVV